VTVGRTPGKKVIVVSHERSGTHFLMNTVALNFGYVSFPYWNFDYELGLNFHSGLALKGYFRKAHDQRVLNIVKSHHDVGFFESWLDYLTSQFHVLYIVRDPRDVIASLSRILNAFPWDEGPRLEKPAALMRAEPCFNMLRYQKQQMPTILHRWKSHVTGWLALAKSIATIHVVRYEDLNLRFDGEIARLAKLFDETVDSPRRPPKSDKVIVPGAGEVGASAVHYTSEDHQWMRDVAGDVMDELGFGGEYGSNP
jgi:hypothetical protein